MGRPLIEINPNEVYEMAKLGCKNTEIADILGCSDETVANRFSEELTKGRAELRRSLRLWQLSSAKKGNVVMMIWLGKQMLGQVERSEIQLSKIPDDVFLAEAQRRLADGSKE